MMIDLVFSKGNAYVWNAEDWLVLRKEHRIVGSLIGCLPKLPRQDILHGLPLLLSPEEATLLIDKKITRLVTYGVLHQEPSKELVEKLKEYREKLFHEQNECLVKERTKMIEMQMDKIIEGKRRKLYGLDTSKKKMKKPLDQSTSEAIKKIEIDREALFAEEVAKITELESSELIIQTHTAYPWANDGDIELAEWKYPELQEEKFRCKVFRDLWERGFYVTSGSKYGGDFLAYPGDPVMFHAQFIIICKKKEEKMTTLDLIAHCRIGTHVRKTTVFAYSSDEDDKVNYQSFSWEDSSTLPFTK